MAVIYKCVSNGLPKLGFKMEAPTRTNHATNEFVTMVHILKVNWGYVTMVIMFNVWVL